MSEDVYLAWSSHDRIRQNGEHGGVVTSLLKLALESEIVDAVLAVKARDGNRYEGVPTLITDPEKVTETAGVLHCASPNIARCLKEYLDGAIHVRVAVVGKPCDIRAIIELAKRNQIQKENLILVGLECTGTLPPATARRMLRSEFDVDPGDVSREDMEDGKLTVFLRDGTRVTRDLAELEEQGYGRRENCRRCDVNIPSMADVACGKWGTNSGKATFVEAFSERGRDLVEKAIKAAAIEVESPSADALEARARKQEAAIHLARKWQDRHFDDLKGTSREGRLDYWAAQFGQCIKCFGCRDACPICYCTDCYLQAHRGLVPGGTIPPDVVFPILRTVHVADSCVNCGQCQDACPSELPLSRLTHMLNVEISSVLEYEPGMDVGAPPPLSVVPEAELVV